MARTVQRKADRSVVRKVIDGVRYVVRAVAAYCCCGGDEVIYYKLRRCSDGVWPEGPGGPGTGPCTINAPPYYVLRHSCTLFAVCGCFFAAEELEVGEECGGGIESGEFTELELDSCDDCDYDENPDPPVDPEVEPTPCPCADECGGDPAGACSPVWRVYVDGWRPRDECTQGNGSTIDGAYTSSGVVDGVYSLGCANPTDIDIPGLSYDSYGGIDGGGNCVEFAGTVTNDGVLVIGATDAILSMTSLEIFGNWVINGTYRCCLPNVYTQSPLSNSGNTYADSGSIVLIPCQS